MGKIFPGWRENILTGQIILFRSSGVVFPLSGKVFNKLGSYATTKRFQRETTGTRPEWQQIGNHPGLGIHTPH